MTTPEQPGDGLPAETQLPLGQVPKHTETPSQFVPTPGLAAGAMRVPGSPTVPDFDVQFAGLLARMANDLFQPAPPTGVTTSVVPAGPAVQGVSMTPQPANVGAAPMASSTAVQPQPPPSDVPQGVPAQAPAFTVPGAAAYSLPGAPANATTSVPALDGRAPPAPVAPGFDASDVEKTQAATNAPATNGASAAAAPPPAPQNPFNAPLSFDTLGDAPRVPLLDGGMHSPLEQGAPYWLQPARSEAPAPVQDRGIFDAHAIAREFPILHQRVNGHRLVWLDNAATTQKPQVVIDRLKHFYEHDNSNIHRAAHTLAARATDAYEQARETVRRFINAPSKNDVIFVRGTTEGINLVAQTFGRRHVNEGDEIVITWLEHHANIVPWHRLCAERKATLKVAPVDDRGQVILEEYEKLLGPKTKLVAFSQVSNALGTVTPAKEMIELAHRHGAKVMLDGAQAVSHMRVDVQQLDCDFYVFSGHKVFAPTGIGVVFGKAALLEAIPPWQGGGNMIQDVTFERIAYQGAPAKFEAGTGNIADAIGLGTALDWLMRLGVENVGRWEHELLEYATPRLLAVPGLKLIGTAPGKAGVLSFVLAGQKTEEVGGLLDKEGIAVRSGHHCAQPILRRFGLEASVRASLAPYNTLEDIDALCAALHRLQVGKPVK